MSTTRTHLRAGLALGAFLGAASLASAQQLTFSVDWQGPTVGVPDSMFAFPITEGDVLGPATGVPAFGPLPAPNIGVVAGFAPGPGLGLGGHLPCAGHLGGTPCLVEVDALSCGKEPRTGPNFPLKYNLHFSVDRQARGFGAATVPNVTSEAAVGDAASDVFMDIGLGAGPMGPFAAVNVGNTGVIDGNGLISGSGALYKGVGIVEPASPAPTLPNPGDNLDALATMQPPPIGFPPTGVYFSLDAAYVDPMTGIANSGSAVAHGFFAADVLHSAAPGGPPAVWAPAGLLGLNLTGAPDDLDALILHENGTGVFEPSMTPNDWMGNGTDMLLFSVRRGSAVIGMPDSIFGLPICEGDILTTPVAGSPSPFPGIYVAAENLGLLSNRIPGTVADDLDALDLRNGPVHDCNGNGVEDAIDIALASSFDVNGNGVPDECETLTSAFCHCDSTAPAPCGNFYAPGGCKNSTGVGAIMTASGTTSVSSDNLVLTTTQMPLNRPGLMFMSMNTVGAVPFYDGLRCLSPQIFRHPIQSTGPLGTWNYGPGLVAYTIGNFPPAGWISSGQTWNFQSWFRDPFGPCGTGANTSNAIQATFTP